MQLNLISNMVLVLIVSSAITWLILMVLFALEMKNLLEMTPVTEKNLNQPINQEKEDPKELQKIGEQMNDLYLDQMQGGMRQ